MEQHGLLRFVYVLSTHYLCGEFGCTMWSFLSSCLMCRHVQARWCSRTHCTVCEASMPNGWRNGWASNKVFLGYLVTITLATMQLFSRLWSWGAVPKEAQRTLVSESSSHFEEMRWCRTSRRILCHIQLWMATSIAPRQRVVMWEAKCIWNCEATFSLDVRASKRLCQTRCTLVQYPYMIERLSKHTGKEMEEVLWGNTKGC